MKRKEYYDYVVERDKKRAIRAEVRARQKMDAQLKADNQRSLGRFKTFAHNRINSINLPFIGGSLSLTGILGIITLCIVGFAVINKVLFFGSSGTNNVTFTSFLNFLETLSMDVIPWQDIYSNVSSWNLPSWLDFIKPLTNTILLIVEMVSSVVRLAFSLIGFLFGF